jgi:NAD(P)-dependent dehydrogenase (short-subunit alcohol dehydrogenase family)
MDMQGRVSLITGGAGHIGLAMAETLAELGSDLVLVDQLDAVPMSSMAAELSERYKIRVEVVTCDLEQETQVVHIPEQIADCFGRLDVLINNAGFVGTSELEGWVTDFDNQSAATWRRALEVNLTAAFVLTQRCRGLLDASGNGSVINVASIYGVYAPDFSLYSGTSMNNPAAYAASKGGLLQLTRWLSTALAPKIRVNAISPGGVARGQPEPFVQRYVAKTPLARMGTEQDFKGVTAFLASDMSRWVTGENIMVDGGWGIW